MSQPQPDIMTASTRAARTRRWTMPIRDRRERTATIAVIFVAISGFAIPRYMTPMSDWPLWAALLMLAALTVAGIGSYGLWYRRRAPASHR